MKEKEEFSYKDEEGKNCIEDENTEILIRLKQERNSEKRKKEKKFSFDSAMSSAGHVQNVRTY